MDISNYKLIRFHTITFNHGLVLWEPYPSHHNGLFSPLFVLRDFAASGRSISVLSEQYETSYLFFVTVSFLCNIICYLISVYAFSLVTLSGATTLRKGNLKRKTESLLMAAQNNAIRTSYIKTKIDNTQLNSKCMVMWRKS